jgi:hypothetical protein
MRSALVLAYFFVSVRLALGQDSSASADASPTPYPPVYPVVVQPAQLPPAIVVQPLSINTVAALPPEQLSLAVQSASQSPTTAQLFLNALTIPQRIAVTNQIIARLQSLTVVDTESNDGDIMLAMAQFATLDPRFRAIGNWSYYGRKLADMRSQIAVQGMTPENKAAMIAIYQNAATALKDFQAREKNP